jgi:hypothetical protein
MIEGSTKGWVGTNPRAPDLRLRGRTYAITFDRVWNAALALAGGGLPRWRLLAADDEQGTIVAEVTSTLWRRPRELRIRIGLDANGQTRVDVQSVSGGRDWGSNARRIQRFVLALDRKLEATAAQILDASRQPQFNT